jgi:hypothetical protein
MKNWLVAQNENVPASIVNTARSRFCVENDAIIRKLKGGLVFSGECFYFFSGNGN